VCAILAQPQLHPPLPAPSLPGGGPGRSMPATERFFCCASVSGLHVYAHASKRGVCACDVCLRVCVCMVLAHACAFACVHVRICACVHACMCACVHVCMHACVHACMCVCARARELARATSRPRPFQCRGDLLWCARERCCSDNSALAGRFLTIRHKRGVHVVQGHYLAFRCIPLLSSIPHAQYPSSSLCSHNPVVTVQRRTHINQRSRKN